ncbi:MAG: hypothetical protein IPG01_10550 [Chitinophagaceae bacterium]|nr:hypothetical protein [Chitinophagaceae bacterium]
METKELERIFKSKQQKKNKKDKIIPGLVTTKFEHFEKWFDEKEFQKGCYYCGTTSERSHELYEMQRNGLRPDGTRGGKRGKRLELDRRDPFQPYDNLDNVVWCCYWCNNSKSNFFTEEEFQPIAIAIGDALKKIK